MKKTIVGTLITSTIVTSTTNDVYADATAVLEATKEASMACPYLAPVMITGAAVITAATTVIGIKNKAKQTRIRKYGSYHPSDYSLKVKATKLERYGDENYVNIDKIKQTVKQHSEENPYYYFDREQKTKAT